MADTGAVNENQKKCIKGCPPEKIKYYLCTLDRKQSKTFLKIDKCGSKIAKNSVFDCHLSPIRRQILFLTIFDLHLSIV